MIGPFITCARCHADNSADALICRICSQPLQATKMEAAKSVVQTAYRSTRGTVQCSRCGKAIGILDALHFDIERSRCGACRDAVRRILEAFRKRFIEACSDAVLTPREWNDLWQHLKAGNHGRLDATLREEALEFVRGDALSFLERNLTFAASDGIITATEEDYIQRMLSSLNISEIQSQPIKARLERLKKLSRVRGGHLTPVHSKAHLHSDEVCYLSAPVTYHKVNSRSTTLIEGKLLATDRKVHFVSTSSGWSLLYDKVMGIDVQSSGVVLHATSRGGGYYASVDPEWVEAVLSTLTRRAKRQIIAPHAGRDTRSIPQHVKTAVWQRDAGKCVQCSATSYLEFDHIIPWSKGGATSAQNLQLLCRKCNADKLDRI